MTAGPEGRTPPSPLVAAALSAVLPGLGQYLIGHKRRALVFGGLSLVVVLGGLIALARDPLGAVKLAFDKEVLLALHGANVIALGWRALAAFDAYSLASRRRPPATGPGAVAGAAGVAIVLLVPHAAFGYYDYVQYDLITSVFAEPAATTVAPPPTTTSPPPSTTAGGPGTTVPGATTTTAPPETTTPTTLPPLWAGEDRLNVLLLGSDAGIGRTGVRTDTMVLVSIDPVSGDAAVFGLPRNMARVPLPESVGIWSCDCYPGILNELYGYAEAHPDAFPGPSGPGPTALKQAVGELLGIPVHYYALVALDGFVDIVDALGGVTITVTERLYDPAYPNEDGTTSVVDLAPGEYHFDGHDALVYARTRWASDDYDRMARQRCVIEAVAAQADPISLLRGFPALAEAIKRSVATDIPLDRIPDLIELATIVDTDEAVGIGFVPPTYTAGRTAEGYPLPNVDVIREHVAIVMELPAAEAIELLGLEPLADVCG